MSTRLTYQKLGLAHQALRELANGNKGTRNDGPAIRLAERCLNVGSGLLQGRKTSSYNSLDREIAGLLEQAANAECAGSRRTRFGFTILHFVERTLGFSVEPANGRGTQELALHEHRQRGQNCGTYGTPEFIAEAMAHDVLDALDADGLGYQLLDLSVEAGQYPVTFLGSARRQKPIQFYAVDRDPAAVRIADKLVSFTSAGLRTPPFEFYYTCQDSLLDDLPASWPSVFSAIVGNPPWKLLGGAAADRLHRKYPDHLIKGRFDAYLVFIARAHSLLPPGGYLCYVVPSAFLFNCSAANTRQFLLNNYDILNLRMYPQRSFVELPCLIPISFLARKREPSSKKIFVTQIDYHNTKLGGVDRPRTSHKLLASGLWKKLPGHVFHPRTTADMEFLISDLPGKALNQWGTLVGGAHLAQTRKQKPARNFHGVHARHIRSFHVCLRNAPVYSRTVPRFEVSPDPSWIILKKVVIQELRYMTHRDRLVAATAGPETCAVSTAMMFFPKRQPQCDFFSALLNSHVANAWYKLRDVSRSIKLRHLRQLPVPHKVSSWKRIGELARTCERKRMLFHKSLSICTIAHEETILRKHFGREFKAFADCRNKIEEQIFDLYGLSKVQREVIRKLSDSRVF